MEDGCYLGEVEGVKEGKEGVTWVRWREWEGGAGCGREEIKGMREVTCLFVFLVVIFIFRVIPIFRVAFILRIVIPVALGMTVWPSSLV